MDRDEHAAVQKAAHVVAERATTLQEESDKKLARRQRRFLAAVIVLLLISNGLQAWQMWDTRDRVSTLETSLPKIGRQTRRSVSTDTDRIIVGQNRVLRTLLELFERLGVETRGLPRSVQHSTNTGGDSPDSGDT